MQRIPLESAAPHIRSMNWKNGQWIENVANYQFLRKMAVGFGYLQKAAQEHVHESSQNLKAVKSYSLG